MRYLLRLLISVSVLVLFAAAADAQEPPRRAVSQDATRTEATPLVVVTPRPSASAPQQIVQTGGKSRARGFFVGGSFEATGVAIEDEDGTESGPGVGLTLGYGFTSTLALYGQLSGASIVDGTIGVGHIDLGLRVHFLAPEKMVVPFVQGGLSARALSADDGPDTVEFGSLGFAFGGGVNVHFKPALAFTTGITWSLGNVDNFKVNGTDVPVDPFGVTTARFHLGIIWFPQSK